MKILATDDDPIILELLTEVLRAAGYANLTACTSASEALNAIEAAQTPFDCFLLDIQMPDVDGIELTSAIRQKPDYTETPILMITAMCDRSYIDKAFAAGASDYITKPFEIGEVHARLRVIESLVNERKWKEDRNPVSGGQEPLAMVNDGTFEKRLNLSEIDGFIDYLALENYIMQISRVSLLGMYTVGIAVRDMRRTFAASSVYEYEAAVSDVAEAMSDTLKPHHFFAAHAGEGEFVCVLGDGRNFDAEDFEKALSETLREMDLHFCDGRPMNLQIAVGDPLSLKMKASKSLPNVLVQAVANAETVAQAGRDQKEEKWGKMSLFGL